MSVITLAAQFVILCTSSVIALLVWTRLLIIAILIFPREVLYDHAISNNGMLFQQHRRCVSRAVWSLNRDSDRPSDILLQVSVLHHLKCDICQ